MPTHIKYPRTYHLPWSEAVADDDKVISTLNSFAGQQVIVTEKMDGENTSMYSDHLHARSLDSRNHPSRNWVKNMWAGIRYMIPDTMRVCGENMYATHSIEYTDLRSYFIGFSVWEDLRCLSWEDTLMWFDELGIVPARVLFSGEFDETTLRDLSNRLNTDRVEGYVVRLADSFEYSEFATSVAKFVRRDHVQTDDHWSHGEMRINEMAP